MAAEKIKGRACWKCKRQPELKDAWCCEPQEEPVHILYRGSDDEIKLYRCVMHYVTPEVAAAYETYWPYSNGQWLPFAGGLWDQPHSLVEAWKVIDRRLAEIGTDA